MKLKTVCQWGRGAKNPIKRWFFEKIDKIDKASKPG